jgi:hypothetical protein
MSDDLQVADQRVPAAPAPRALTILAFHQCDRTLRGWEMATGPSWHKLVWFCIWARFVNRCERLLWVVCSRS